MPLFPSLHDPARLAERHARFPANIRPLMGYTVDPPRVEAALSIGARRLIATHVSALNACASRAGAQRAHVTITGGHPAEGSTPEEQAGSDRRFCDMVEKLAAG